MTLLPNLTFAIAALFQAGWAVVYEETSRVTIGSEHVSVAKLRSRAGKEGLLVIFYHSGAGTATNWHVRSRAALLKRHGYVDNGYNGVTAEGDRVVERMAGYSGRAARCCPDRPPVEMGFRFTGTAIEAAGFSSGSPPAPAGRTPSAQTAR